MRKALAHQVAKPKETREATWLEVTVPWDCKSCGQHVAFDTESACPACGVGKTAWTVVGGLTRTMTVPKAKKLKVLRGVLSASLPPDDPGWLTRELVDTKAAPAVTKSEARALVERGLLPASSHLLFVRVTPGGSQPGVAVAVDFEQAELAEHPLDRPLVAGGTFDLIVLLVYGPGGVDGIAFPGIDVLDVSEASETGHAFELEVTGLGKAPIELPIEAVAGDPPEPDPEDLIERVEASALRFANDSPLPFPLEGAGAHPLQALVVAAGFLHDRPEHVLVLAGHASTPGSGKHNAKLSQARADGLAQLIRGERDGWVETATEHGSLQDMKTYFSYLTRERGWSCDPGPITPANDKAAKAGVEAFQAEYNQRFEGGLAEDGVCGKQTLGAIFDVLAFELERWLEKHGLTQADLRLHPQVPVMPCGETLAENPKLPQPASEESRRFVDLLLLSPTVQAALGTPTAATVYADPYRFEDVTFDPEPGAWEHGELLVVTDLDLNDLMHGRDVRYVLKSDQGYEQTRSAQRDGIDIYDGVDLLFDAVPTTGTFTLCTHENDQDHVVFSGASYADMCQPVELAGE